MSSSTCLLSYEDDLSLPDNMTRDEYGSEHEGEDPLDDCPTPKGMSARPALGTSSAWPNVPTGGTIGKSASRFARRAPQDQQRGPPPEAEAAEEADPVLDVPDTLPGNNLPQRDEWDEQI